MQNYCAKRYKNVNTDPPVTEYNALDPNITSSYFRAKNREKHLNQLLDGLNEKPENVDENESREFVTKGESRPVSTIHLIRLYIDRSYIAKNIQSGLILSFFGLLKMQKKRLISRNS